jgi:hypothetical protein
VDNISAHTFPSDALVNWSAEHLPAERYKGDRYCVSSASVPSEKKEKKTGSRGDKLLACVRAK